MKSETVDNLWNFVRERWQIQLRRAAGKSKPWTTDPILQNYRFTCVYREDDAVTRWIAANWRKPHAREPELWFALTVARLLNLPESLEAVGWPIPWRPKSFRRVLQLRAAQGRRNFNAAYIVSTNGNKMDKVEYVADRILTPLWEERALIAAALRGRSNCSLRELHAHLTQFQGLGSFMAAQVIADLKHTPQLRNAPDWWTWAASGPGSRRGLNRLCARSVDAPWKETEWLRALHEVQTAMAPRLEAARMPRMCAQDTQGICCCEFDKYERARLGEGRPKQLFEGAN